MFFFFFFKQKTAYEMRISDWSSDVCSSDLEALRDFSDRDMRFAFVSNVDGTDFSEAVRGLDPAETLFIVCSKTFTTLETQANAHAARAWRSEERRVGKECGRTCRSRGSPYH